MAKSLSDQERLAWLRLIRTPRIGPATFFDLIHRYGSAEEALAALPTIGYRHGVAMRPANENTIRHEIDEAHRHGAHFVAVGEAGYPSNLAELERPPPILCVRANSGFVAVSPAVSIVGSRNASAAGLTWAKAAAQDLGEAGLIVVSGLARGIDASAHLGALGTGTWAFFAGGLASTYPPEHTKLADEIVDKGGALYSEMPLGWTARAQDFPRRNRLVAGSSLATIVVEAARKSGSLITAKQATEMGRLVMAVPGFPLDPRSEGPNALLRDGATLVRDAVDILAELGPMLANPRLSNQTGPSSSLFGRLEEPKRPQAPEADPPAESILEGAMSLTFLSADRLIEVTGLPAHTVRVWLLENELTGRIIRSAGDLFAWNPDNNP